MRKPKKYLFTITLVIGFCFISFAQIKEINQVLFDFHFISSLNAKEKEKVQSIMLKNNQRTPQELQQYLSELDSLNIPEITDFLTQYQMMLDSMKLSDTLIIRQK